MRRRLFTISLLACGLLAALGPGADAIRPVGGARTAAAQPVAGPGAAARPCEGFRPGDTDPGVAATPELTDRCLRLNQIQTVGTHNSYHAGVEPAVFELLKAFDAGLAASLEYSHPELATQFGEQRARQIELDVFADPEGGRYSVRHGNVLIGRGPTEGVPAVMSEPGFKVFHVQEIDYQSRCWTFVSCLEQVKAWSAANPGHLPITILVEPKDDVIPDPLALDFTQPIPFTTALMTALDAEVRSVFSADEMITPDDVRGTFPTLEAAVLSGRGWPRLRDARGKVMFVLDGRRELYVPGNPNLEGRVFFTPSSPGQPDAAFLKRNDPLGDDGQDWRDIRKLVRKGYVIRTRSDSDTVQARNGDPRMRNAALRSAAQWVSTDYPTLADNIFGTGYFVAMPRNLVARCNPVAAGPRCRSNLLEP